MTDSKANPLMQRTDSRVSFAIRTSVVPRRWPSSLGHPMQASDIAALVAQQLGRISQPELARAIRPLLVPPRCEPRPWDYGEPNQTYPCWIVVEHRPSNTAIAFCEAGFGPSYPWGLLFLSGPYLNMGMDSQWSYRLR